MSIFGGAMDIGSHTETMVTEEEKVDNSKNEMLNSFGEYTQDNCALTSDWQGDCAGVFLDYSNRMNEVLRSAIGLTDIFRINIFDFYSQSRNVDTQASVNAEGENNDGMQM